jgi:hypothetical protein
VRCSKGHRTVFYCSHRWTGFGLLLGLWVVLDLRGLWVEIVRFPLDWLWLVVLGLCQVVGGRGLCRVGAFGVSGRSQCRVGGFGRGGLRESDFLFITVSHCAWRHVISLSKATKKRSKENAFNHATLSVHSVQFSFIGAPKVRCSPEPLVFETLLLANPDMNTLRPQRSRASSCHHGSTQPSVVILIVP